MTPATDSPRVSSASKVYAALDIAFAALYATLPHTVAPTPSTPLRVASYLLAACMVAAALGTLSTRRIARRVAVGALAIVGATGLALIGALVASAAFLDGVYGAVGRGIALLALVASALVVQFYLLVPGLQIAHLVRRRPS